MTSKDHMNVNAYAMFNWWINRVPADSAGVRAGDAASVGWQVTLSDPIWHAGSRSGEVLALTAIHRLLTYLLLSKLLASVRRIQHKIFGGSTTAALRQYIHVSTNAAPVTRDRDARCSDTIRLQYFDE